MVNEISTVSSTVASPKAPASLLALQTFFLAIAVALFSVAGTLFVVFIDNPSLELIGFLIVAIVLLVSAIFLYFIGKGKVGAKELAVLASNLSPSEVADLNAFAPMIKNLASSEGVTISKLLDTLIAQHGKVSAQDVVSALASGAQSAVAKPPA